ncbi:MAG TPA: hypothetical protein PLH27_15635 [bacterium]|nr:hypothetical protein [bacterium]
MKQPAKHILSRLILIAYVPLVMLLPFFHTDRLPCSAAAQTIITDVENGHHLSDDADFCLAHQYSASHSLVQFHGVSHVYIPLFEIVCYLPIHTTSLDQVHAGRGPPVIS